MRRGYRNWRALKHKAEDRKFLRSVGALPTPTKVPRTKKARYTFWRQRFRRFWGGVAGWPRSGGSSGPAGRYLIAKGGHVPDFGVDAFGLVYLMVRRHKDRHQLALHSTFTGAHAPSEVE